MIWDSVFLMTLIDVSLITLVIVMLVAAVRGGLLAHGARGPLLIVAGAGVLGIFFLLDLIAMHVLPITLGPNRASQIAALLHLELSWITAPVCVALVFSGFIALLRGRERDESRRRLMMDALPLGVAYVDRHRKYAYANAQYAEACGLSADEIVGRPMPQLYVPATFEDIRHRYAGVWHGERLSLQTRMPLKSGNGPRDLQFDLIPDTTADGSVMGVFCFLRDVTDGAQLERDVIHAAEAERLDIARDLHDGLGQILTGLSLGQSALLKRLVAEESTQIDFARELAETSQRAIEQIRHYTRQLAPVMEGGLPSALEDLAHQVATLYGIPCRADCPAFRQRIDEDTTIHLYRIAQESVRNAARHGQPRRIEMSLRVEDDSVVLTVSDDGAGISGESLRQPGFGLKSMIYRARLLGGSLRIAPRPEGGTVVVCRVPRAPAAARSAAGADSGAASGSSRNPDCDPAADAHSSLAETSAATPAGGTTRRMLG